MAFMKPRIFSGFFSKVAVGHVLDRAEAAAAEVVELVDAQHAGVLGGELLELDALEVGEADARVDVAAEDGGGDVHADAHGLERVERDARLLGKVVDHDLAEVADVPDLLALDVRELVDVGRLLVDEAGWRLVEERAEALHVDALVPM